MRVSTDTATWQNFIQEALENFAVLIDDLDYDEFFMMLGIGRLQFLRRKQMFVELKALHMALWRLGLASSFPNDAQAMFAIFLRRYGRAHTGKTESLIIERATQYWDMLLPGGAADFSSVARHLISFSPKISGDQRSLTLKIALAINSAYNFIFDRII